MKDYKYHNGKVLALAALLVALLCAAHVHAGSRGQGLIRYLSTDRVTRLLQESGHEYEVLRQGVHTLTVDGLKMVLFSEQDGILLYSGFRGYSVPESLMNTWNKKATIGRAYIDDDGDFVVEAGLRLDGGVTEEYLLCFIDNFAKLSHKAAATLRAAHSLFESEKPARIVPSGRGQSI